ncbi:hypothetical protein ONS95_008328 [Cadophora gregata]|uniref:uncharacterized protein n=1 Tax=Cadophora gregata TaxID=51156 RepID=UPI0026DC63A3|nr:uncharacterized protein ONS95_008328 [Cadophora gregata]KAK0100374.1 hypothetical protein ONS96_007654 [Cadophora gregata f. sp. sojae]KAK0126748.1 hypothetical protein ONS95_008328 [Cadophora gregata]
MEIQADARKSSKLAAESIASLLDALADSTASPEMSAIGIPVSGNISVNKTVIANHKFPAIQQSLEHLEVNILTESKMMTHGPSISPSVRVEQNSNVPSNGHSLSSIPFELRDKIFEHCIEIIDGKTPTLMIALRCNKTMYSQALGLYCKYNYFILNRITIKTMKNVSRKAIAKIRNLCIDNRSGVFSTMGNNFPGRVCSGWHNLRTVAVLSGGRHDFLDPLWARLCVWTYKSITKVFYARGSQDEAYRQRRPIEFLDKGLGLPHIAAKVRIAEKDFDGVMWDTRSLKPLTWTEEDLFPSDYLW